MSPDDVRHLTLLAIALAVATYGKYVLKISMKEYISLFLSEIKDVADGNWTPGAINAVGMICAGLVLLIALALPKSEKFLTLAGLIPNSTDQGTAAFGAAALLIIGTLACVHMICPRR